MIISYMYNNIYYRDVPRILYCIRLKPILYWNENKKIQIKRVQYSMRIIAICRDLADQL